MDCLGLDYYSVGHGFVLSLLVDLDRHMLANFMLSDAQRAQLSTRLSQMRMALARHLAEGNKLVALKYFFMSQAGHLPTLNSLIVFAKILTPSVLIAWRRNKYVAPVKHGF